MRGDQCHEWLSGGSGTNTNPDDGTYTIMGLLPGNYYMETNNNNQSNYVNEWWSSGGSTYACEDAESVTVTSGGELTGIYFQLDLGGSITGMVYKSDGETPITDAEIQIGIIDGDPCGENQWVAGINTETGAFTVNGVAPGDYYLITNHMDQSNYFDEWWSSGGSTCACEDAESLTVTSGSELTGIYFQLDLGGSISGRVTDQGGSPIVNMHVYVQPEGCGGDWLGGSDTDSNGDYTIKGIPEGDVYVQTCSSCSGLNYIDELYDNKTDCKLASEVNIIEGQDTPNIDFQLDIGATISGTVYQEDRVTPIKGVQIEVGAVFGERCNPWGVDRSAQTDASNGTYTIIGVPPGNYYLITKNMNQSNYVNEWWASAGSTLNCNSAEAVEITSAGQEVTDIHFQLDDGSSISGTVTDQGGFPIVNMHVYVQSEGCGGDWLGGSNTDSNGDYTIKGIPEGDVYVQTCSSCSGLNYIDELYDNKTDCDQADPVTVTQGTNTPNIDFQLGMDTDGDGITDYDEINVYGTDPYIADTDVDGINDGDELDYWGSNWSQDPDGDGYSNLVDEDSDNDGYLDGEEIFKGSDPADSGSTPQTYLYDDFSGTYIDSQKWDSREFVREIDPVAKKLVSKIGNDMFTSNARNNTSFQNPSSIDVIKFDIIVVSTNLDVGTNSKSFARVDGRFYNTLDSGTEEGDIWAAIFIGDRGSGLEAWWEVWESLDDEGNSWEERGSGTLIVPGLTHGDSYTVELKYDRANNQFTFDVGGVKNDPPFTGPARQGTEFHAYKGLETGVYSDGGSGIGYASALFDNVYINNETTAYDTFDTAPLDPTLWNSREKVREITGGHKMLLAAHTEGQREQSTQNFSEFQPYVEAKVIVKSESEVFNGAVGRFRIDGYFFNDTHGPGEYNGYEGNVWANVCIDLYDDGSIRAACYVGKSMNYDESDWSDLFWDEFSIPIQTDREYSLGIHYTGSHFVFKCMDNETSEEQYKAYEITAINQYAAYNQYTGLRTRAYGNGSGDGYMKVEFDDVYVINEPVSSCPGDFDTDGDVDGSDLAVFAADFGRTDCDIVGHCEGDFDDDGDVDGSDLAVFAADFGRADCPQ